MPISEVSGCEILSNHHDINSDWKWLVALAVCECGWSWNVRSKHFRLYHYNNYLQLEMCSFPLPKVLALSDRSVVLECQNCLSQAQNVFITRDKHISLQCDLCLFPWQRVPGTISSLAMQSLVCFVKSHLEGVAKTISSWGMNKFVVYLKVGSEFAQERSKLKEAEILIGSHW